MSFNFFRTSHWDCGLDSSLRFFENRRVFFYIVKCTSLSFLKRRKLTSIE